MLFLSWNEVKPLQIWSSFLHIGHHYVCFVTRLLIALIGFDIEVDLFCVRGYKYQHSVCIVFIYLLMCFSWHTVQIYRCYELNIERIQYNLSYNVVIYIYIYILIFEDNCKILKKKESAWKNRKFIRFRLSQSTGLFTLINKHELIWQLGSRCVWLEPNTCNKIRLKRKLRSTFTASCLAVYWAHGCFPSANTTHASLKGAISHLDHSNPKIERKKEKRKWKRVWLSFDMCGDRSRETLSSYYLSGVKRDMQWGRGRWEHTVL